jgi:hypothetical protein
MARMPKTKSVSAWASFLKEEDLSVASAIDRTTSFPMKEWLRENTFKIIEAIEKEEATATFITEAKIIEEPEKEEVKSKPVKGVRV